MQQEPQVVYVDIDDEITTVREKLSRVRPGVVALVVPERAVVFESVVSLKLLQRYGRESGLDLVLVGGSRVTKELARSQGIAMRGSLRGVDRNPLETRRPPTTADVRAEAPRVATLRRLSTPLRTMSLGARLASYALGLGLLGVAALAVILIVPSATVTLTPTTRLISEDLLIKADPALKASDVAQRAVPARARETELVGNDRTSTSGRKRAADSTARGMVTLANKTTEEVKVPRNTVVSTSSKVRFYTADDTTVPAQLFASARVAVVAAEPGQAGNVSRLQINSVDGPLSFKLAVLNEEAFTGGSEKEITYVTDADRDRVRKALTETLKTKGIEELRKALGKDDSLPVETITLEVIDESFDKAVDQEATAVTCTMRVRVRGAAFNGQEVNTLALDTLRNQLPPNFEFMTAALDADPPVIQKVDGKAVTFKMRVRARAVAKLDENQIKELVKGLDREAAALSLVSALELSDEPKIETSPPWVNRVSQFAFRIKVKTIQPKPGLK